MDPKIIEEISKAVAEELRNKERASVVLEVDGRRVKGVGISTGFLTPHEVHRMYGLGEHADPFSDLWAEKLSLYAAMHLCGPAEPGTVLVRDRAPICEFGDVPTDGCEFRCGPVLVLGTDTGRLTAPPCHGAGKPACAGITMFPDLCTMIKAAGCRPRWEFANYYAYSVSVLDFSNREYKIHYVELQVDDKPLATYSFGWHPEQKQYDEILYLYMVIAFPYDFRAVPPPEGAE
jgi:hypothetical protein